MKNRELMIITVPCWNCERDMLVALLGEEGGPELFSESEKELARKHGVVLKVVDSKTAGQRYLANACTHCGEFVGKWYHFANYYAPAMYGELIYRIV